MRHRISILRYTLAAVAVALVGALPASRANAQTELRASSFTVRYGDSEDPAFQEVRRELVALRLLEDMAAVLDSVFILPAPIELAFDECGNANAFYYAEARSVSFCYELFQLIAETAVALGEDEDEIEAIIAGTFAFILLHELGHALIDVLDLPITGREEDAADQLAVLALLEDTAESGGAYVAGAALFFHRLDPEVLADFDFADEHSLGRQRFFNLACWVYGQDPVANADLVTDGVLPESRATQCPGEYRRMSLAWESILAPFTR